jgi:hypothetical protein
MAPDIVGGFAVGLDEDLADGGRDHRLLVLGDMTEQRTHEMHNPNAIDRIHFTATLAFVWPHLAKPRHRRR